MRPPAGRCASIALGGALLLGATASAAETTNYLDLNAGAGFSSNPNLGENGSSSAYGRLSLSGGHAWISETGTTTLTGYVENTTYVRGGYGSQQIFTLGASTHQNLSPTVTMYGELGFSGDLSGQLSNRLRTVPGQPVPPDPGNPLPPVGLGPDTINFTGRQYTLSGNVGASIRTGARTSVSLSAGAEHLFFSHHKDSDYTSYFGSAGFLQELSERTSAGGTLFLQHQDFNNGNYSDTANPVATIRTQLSDDMSATAAVGVMAIRQRTDGHSDTKFSPSFSGSLCKGNEISQLCAHVSRDAQSALSSGIGNASGGAAISTTAGVDWFRRVGEGQTIQLSLSGTHHSSVSDIASQNLRTTYLTGVAGYDRSIGHRLYVGIQGGARRLFQDGPDPDTDLNATVYLRYRLGDLQ